MTLAVPYHRKPLGFLRNCLPAERHTAYATSIVHFLLSGDTPDSNEPNTPDSNVAMELITALAESIPETPEPGESGTDPVPFLPEPKRLSEILRLPPHLRDPWIKALVAEIRGLI